MIENPFISIIVPTYNRANLIAATLKTLQDQNYPNYEIIVVDDGSTDDTEKVVKEAANARVKYYRKNNAERGAARNYGARIAKGDYINFFDSDDLALPNHLSEAVLLIGRHNAPEWFHLGYGWVDTEGNKIKSDSFFQAETLNKGLAAGNILSCNGVFVRKDIAAQNTFNEDRALSASEDYELWLRLAARFPLYHSNTITSLIVDHDSRSVRKINGEGLIKRMGMLLYYLQQDKQVLNFYAKDFEKVKLDVNTYLALHLAELSGFKLKSFKYLIRSFVISPQVIFSRRYLASIRNLIFKW